MVSYKVKVYTGHARGAGTDAHVHIKISGERGDSGVRELRKSGSHTNKFERGKVDEFTIEVGFSRTLRPLSKLHKSSSWIEFSHILEAVERSV